MSKFLLLNFEDFGLNQDITKTIQSHTLFCICCLKRNVPHINLLTCSHSEFLNSFGIPELNPVNQVICYQCHDMLKKIKLFKLQVESSLKLLVSQQNNPKSTNQRLNNLMIQKVIDITIPLTNSFEIQTNPETTDKNNDSEFKFEIPIINAGYFENSSTTKSVTEKKIMNIEEALRIIDGNKSNDCINLLATSLKTFASANLSTITDVLLSGGGNASNDIENTLKPETNITETLNRDIEEVSEITIPDVANTEIANKSLPALKEEDGELPMIVKVESIKTENVLDMTTDITEEQPVNEQKNVTRINLTTVKLSKEELMQERLNTAASEAYLSSPHRCDWCLLGFHYKENLDDHMKRKHTTRLGSVTCEVCLQVLYPPGSYNAHTFRHYTRLECSVCSKRFELHKEAEAIEHYKKEHTKPIHYICEQCPYNTRLKDKFKSHVRKHSRFTCKVCGACFDKLQKLKSHVESSQHIAPSSTKSRVKRTRTRLYRCKTCKKIFKEATSLQMHRLLSHPEAPESNRDLHVCQQCGKKYKNKANLKLHLASHLTQEKNTNAKSD